MKKLFRNRKGSLLLNSVILMVVLLLTGAAFLQWAADEAYQARFDLARTQAYYIAQKGAIEGGLSYLRSKTEVDLPRVKKTLPPTGREYFLNIGEETYTYVVDSYVDPVYYVLNSEVPENELAAAEEFNIYATGVVGFRQPNGETYEVERSFRLKVQKPALSKYFYFTDSEVTEFGEIIWFYGEDDVYGPVRSNDEIGIKGSPRFYSEVITVADDFIHGDGFAPEFNGPDPVFEADSVILSDRASELRLAADTQGSYFDNRSGEWQTRIVAESNGWHVMQWGAGTPFPDDGLFDNEATVPYSMNAAIFVEGTLELYGNRVKQRATIGSEGDMRLLDDIRYADYSARDLTTENQQDSYYMADRGSENILGLISESRVRIANTIENGKGNGGSTGDWSDHDNKHIIITGAIITLGGSFDFENQNNRPDDIYGWDGYWWCDDEGDHANDPDERGAIYLRGSVIQKQRGYVHRSNCSGTGYDKAYAYDIRMWKTPPPYFPKETDADGRYDFQIVSSWDQDPTRREDFE